MLELNQGSKVKITNVVLLEYRARNLTTRQESRVKLYIQKGRTQPQPGFASTSTGE